MSRVISFNPNLPRLPCERSRGKPGIYYLSRIQSALKCSFDWGIADAIHNFKWVENIQI